MAAKKFKSVFITIIIIFGVFIAGKYTLEILFGDMCGNDTIQKIPSPSGDEVAYSFKRSCGATTGNSAQLSILEKDEPLQNKAGNTFRADKDFSFKWLSDDTLQVIYDIKSETYEMDKRVNGIRIEYVGR
jgi:hypothetical protein